MVHFISRAFARINSFLKVIQAKSFLATFLVGLIVLTSSFNLAASNPASANISNRVFESNSDRPTTTNEWYQKARETEGDAGERLKEIGKESAEAVKEFGQLYPDTAERTAPEALKD